MVGHVGGEGRRRPVGVEGRRFPDDPDPEDPPLFRAWTLGGPAARRIPSASDATRPQDRTVPHDGTSVVARADPHRAGRSRELSHGPATSGMALSEAESKYRMGGSEPSRRGWSVGSDLPTSAPGMGSIAGRRRAAPHPTPGIGSGSGRGHCQPTRGGRASSAARTRRPDGRAGHRLPGRVWSSSGGARAASSFSTSKRRQKSALSTRPFLDVAWLEIARWNHAQIARPSPCGTARCRSGRRGSTTSVAPLNRCAIGPPTPGVSSAINPRGSATGTAQPLPRSWASAQGHC